MTRWQIHVIFFTTHTRFIEDSTGNSNMAVYSQGDVLSISHTERPDFDHRLTRCLEAFVIAVEAYRRDRSRRIEAPGWECSQQRCRVPNMFTLSILCTLYIRILSASFSRWHFKEKEQTMTTSKSLQESVCVCAFFFVGYHFGPEDILTAEKL